MGCISCQTPLRGIVFPERWLPRPLSPPSGQAYPRGRQDHASMSLNVDCTQEPAVAFALTISGGTSVWVKRLMSSPSAADGPECLRSSSSSRKVGTRLVVFFGATATCVRGTKLGRRSNSKVRRHAAELASESHEY